MRGAGSFVIVANRLPVRRDGETGAWVTSPGGLVSALAPIIQERAGSWVGWTGIEDDAPSPFDHDGMHLVPVSLSAQEVERYYQGFCNDTIWPLYHNAIRTPAYHRRWWAPYRAVNRRFAEAASRAVDRDGTAWIHDYQLQLVPGMLRDLRPDLTVGFFLHIPFPPMELFAYLPWRAQVLQGLLGADVLAFQTPEGVYNFRRAALRYTSAREKGDDLQVGDRTVQLQAAPISIDTEAFRIEAGTPRVRSRMGQLRETLSPALKLVLGVDRLDYTKGIDHRLRAIQTFHLRYPEVARTTVFLQVAVPSREEITQYREEREEVERLVGRINGDFGSPDYTPVVYMYRNLEFDELVAAYATADVMLVTPLADGMNLVAKEYVASRTADDGVLVLSEFAGAAAELSQAIMVNPLDLDGLAEALRIAVTLPEEERARRMAALRSVVHGNDVFRWARSCLEPLLG